MSMNGQPYRGPCVMLTLDEARYVRDILHVAPHYQWEDGAMSASVQGKCAAALAADPRFRLPTK